MSKKSRRRNKKLLALAGLAGAVALSNRKGTGTGVSGSDKAKFTSDEAYSPPKKDTSTDVVAAPKEDKVNNSTFRTRGRITDSAGNTVESAGVKPDKMPDTAPPSIDNPYKARTGTGARRFGTVNYRKDGGRAKLKSGGKVKGCGIAKRGFGKAMKKGKK